MTIRGSPSTPVSAGSRPASAEADVSPGRLRTAGTRRRIPYLATGVLLVLACAAAAVITSMRLDRRVAVLMLARPVVVGQVLSAPDVRQIAISDDASLDAVPLAAAGSVFGRPVAFSLPAGALLTRGLVGPPQIPPSGQAVVAVGLRSGQFPPSLSPGARVAVDVAATNLASSASGAESSASGGGPGAPPAPVAQWNATVVEVSAPSQDDQNTVISLQLPQGDARQLSAVPPGQVGLVELSPGGS